MKRYLWFLLLVPLLLGVYGEVQPDGTYSIQGLWHLNDNSSPESDDSGNNYDATVSGATYVNIGVFGGAYSFDGSNDVLNVGSSTCEFQDASWTVSAWINPDSSPPSQQVYFSAHHSNVTRRTLHFRIYSDGKVRIGYWFDDLTSDTGIITYTGDWQHVVVTYDYSGDTTTLYHNGEYQTSGSQGPFDAASPYVRIGSWNAVEHYKGDIDEVIVFDRALSATEIKTYYNNAKGAYGHSNILN